MIATLLIGLAAGSASALIFASIASGALISILLLYLAPLPLMVAAIGWGPLCAAIGGIAASIALGALFGLPLCIAFAIAIALPGWWLGHLVLLGRPVAANDGAEPVVLEWYPVGRILLWIAVLATLTTVVVLLTLGTDAATIAATLKRGLLSLLAAGGGNVDDAIIEALVAIIPICAVISVILILLFNLWLAAKVAATSGRLRRPWPDMKSAALPSMTLAALCVAIAFCFAGGLLAMLAKIVTSALIMAYACTGFAVLHTVTLALKSRLLWLGSTYALVALFTWPLLAVAVLGLADAVFGVRQRYWRSRPPPLPAA